MVPFLACASDSRAEASVTAFLSQIKVFPLPGRVQGDCETETLQLRRPSVQKKVLHVFKSLFFDVM